MTEQINLMTGAPDLWSEPQAAPDGQAKLADHIHQTWRNRHVPLADHPSLMEVANRLGQAGKLDLTKGQAGIDAFCDEVAAELGKPEANGETGLIKDIMDTQRAMGLI